MCSYLNGTKILADKTTRLLTLYVDFISYFTIFIDICNSISTKIYHNQSHNENLHQHPLINHYILENFYCNML